MDWAKPTIVLLIFSVAALIGARAYGWPAPLAWVLFFATGVTGFAAGLGYTAARIDERLPLERRIFWRVLGRIGRVLVPFVIGAVAAIAGLLLVLVQLDPDDLARTFGFLISGLVVAIGWIATATASEFRQELERHRKRQDTMTALRMEIVTFVEKLDSFDILQNRDTQLKKIALGEPGRFGQRAAYQSFAISESDPVVFEALSDVISGLESRVVEAVIQFYAEYTDMQAAIADTRLAVFQDLPPNRRAAFMKILAKRRARALSKALEAIEVIEPLLDTAPTYRVVRTGKNETINARE